MKPFLNIVLLLSANVISCEKVVSQNYSANKSYTFLPNKYTIPSPDLDSTMDVSKLSFSVRTQLISKLFEADQRYRIQLNKVGWTLKNKQTDYCWRMMAINDSANRALLLKILRLDGWPCEKNIRSESLSKKAWHIAWHGGNNYRELMKFYPYLLTAQKQGCIDNKLFHDFDITVKHLYKVGYR